MKYPKIRYYEDSDSLAIDLAPGIDDGAREIGEGIVATFDKQGRVLALELFNDVARDYPQLVEAAREQQASERIGAGPAPGNA